MKSRLEALAFGVIALLGAGTLAFWFYMLIKERPWIDTLFMP